MRKPRRFKGLVLGRPDRQVNREHIAYAQKIRNIFELRRFKAITKENELAELQVKLSCFNAKNGT